MGITFDRVSRTALSASEVKLIFFDIDGTLMGADHLISNQVRDELARVRSQGVTLALASGRPSFAAKHLMNELGITGPSVFYAGAVIISPQNGAFLACDALAPDDVRRIVAGAAQHGIHTELYTADAFHCETDSPLSTEIHASYMGVPPRIGPLEDVIRTSPILKVGLMTTKEVDEAVLAKFLSSISGYNVGIAYGAAHPHIKFTSITSPHASRERAFTTVVQSLGLLSAQVAAFGDGESDMAFLRAAGYGVAMANAPRVVQDAAGFITKSVAEDGVAHALRLLVPEKR